MSESNEDKKKLLSNFFSLSALQAANMILPLVTLPYLVRVLGVETFGLVTFSLSIIMYFNILVNFGFELSATREVSIHRGSIEKLSEIFVAVMVIKLILVLISFVTLIFLIFSIDKLNDNAVLYYASFGIVIGNLLFPSWLFQGMERMKYITYINVGSRLFFTILIFVFVKDSSDFIYVPVLTSLGAIFGGLYSLWLAFNIFKLELPMPAKSLVFSQLKGSYHFFISSAANNGSRYFATTMIGLYFGNIAVGYYAMAEKLFYAFMTLPSVVSQTIYPYMSRTKNLVFLKKVILLLVMVSIIILMPTMYFHEMVLRLVFDIQNDTLSKLFLILFSGAFFGVVSTLLGYPLLAALGYSKYANNSQILASIIFMIFVTISVLVFKNIFLVALSAVVYQLTSLFLRIYYVYKLKVF